MIVIKLETRFVTSEKNLYPTGTHSLVFGGFRVDGFQPEDFPYRPFWRVRVPHTEIHHRAAACCRRTPLDFLITGFSVKGKTVYASGLLYESSRTPLPPCAPEPLKGEPVDEPDPKQPGLGVSDKSHGQ